MAMMALALVPLTVLAPSQANAAVSVSVDTEIAPSPVGSGLTRFTYTLHNNGETGDPGVSVFTLPFFDDYNTITATPGANFNAPIGWTWVFNSGVGGFSSYGYSAAADPKAATYDIPATTWETGATSRLSFLAGSIDTSGTILQYASDPASFIGVGESKVFSIDVGYSKSDNGPFMALAGDFDNHLHGAGDPIIGDPLVPITPGHPLYDGPRAPEPATVALVTLAGASLLIPRRKKA
ncbi:MAG: hypothetical protein NTW19_10045 [Planctomycetota bacterium]|nr:hypothetical protein [Planctomycetota bacterium]